jgi:hypothetical protein
MDENAKSEMKNEMAEILKGAMKDSGVGEFVIDKKVNDLKIRFDEFEKNVYKLIESRDGSFRFALKKMDEKVQALHNMMNIFMPYFKEIEARITGLTEFVLEHRGMGSIDILEEFQDKARGMKRKLEGDMIVAGDVVWVEYETEVTGEGNKKKMSNVLVKMGSGTIAFEEALLGHCVGETVKYGRIFKDSKFAEWKDKAVNFTVTINKVKTSLKGVKDGSVKEGGAEQQKTQENNSPVSEVSKVEEKEVKKEEA